MHTQEEQETPCSMNVRKKTGIWGKSLDKYQLNQKQRENLEDSPNKMTEDFSLEYMQPRR